MAETNPPRVTKLPFWLADVALLATAGVLVAMGGRPLRTWEMLAVAACAGLGGWLAVLPFLRDHEAAVKFAETDRLSDTVARIGQLDAVAGSIAGATGQWQAIQEQARATANGAREVLERLAREAEAFAATVSRTADSERQTLKLEVEKLRRSEGDWLQVVGRLMDHVYALHVAAVRSGQPALADQVERFHAACRDIVRRVGLVPMVAAPEEGFDPRKHQSVDEASPAVAGAKIDETVAPGYLFQGRLLRPVIVRLAGAGAGADPGTEGAGTAPAGRDGSTTRAADAEGAGETPIESAS